MNNDTDETENQKKTHVLPVPLVDLLPGISGIYTKETMNYIQNLEKKPKQTIAAIPSSHEKAFEPLPLSSLTPFLMALKQPSPHRGAQSNQSARKRNWNSSVKVNKTINHTANRQMAHSSVRKVLNFVPKPKATDSVKTSVNINSQKFPKPVTKARKTLQLQDKVNVRISGITNITGTPATQYDSKYGRRTIANKENNSNNINNSSKSSAIPVFNLKISSQTKPLISIPDTPLSNMSWKSSCDSSFLEIEKEIQEKEAETSILKKVEMLEDTVLPLKDHKQIPNAFDNSIETTNSACIDKNTIMCFNKVNKWKIDNKREESVIVSLCEKLKEATFNDCCEQSLALEDLLELKQQTKVNIEMVDQSIKYLIKVKDSHLKSMECVEKLIKEKTFVKNEIESIQKISETEVKTDMTEPVLLGSSKPCSVIRSCPKSPSYKIPRRSLCLRKKVFHKSMPNMFNGFETPEKNGGNTAQDMYMKMKEQMGFLKTPVDKYNKMEVLNTPTATSRNLQRQLNNLYNCS